MMSRPERPGTTNLHSHGPAGRRWLVALVAALWFGAMPPAGTAQETGAVYIVPITGTIDLGLAPYLARVLDEAAENEAAAVLLEINTPGGRLDAVLEMQDALLDSEVRTIAFVNRTAFSAGALVAIASEEIYMVPGAVMGAATPIEGGTGETASEKVVSAVRKTFKTTAEVRGRNPSVAEAMVDPEVEIPGLIERGKLLTLTSTEAQDWGYADGIVANRAELLVATGLSGAPIVETSPSLAERVVRFITDPIIASLLITLAILLIIGDFLVGGVGVVALVGAGFLATFFWGHMLVGLAGWEDLALVLLGVVLIAVEVLVIPGFGVAGILGLAALLGGLFLAMLGREIVTPAGIERAGLTVGVSFVAIVLGFVAILLFLPRMGHMGGLVLDARLGDAIPVAAREPRGWLRLVRRGESPPAVRQKPVEPAVAERSLTGATGVALSDLRPGGIAAIGGNRVDVITSGEYIAAGEPVEVVNDERYRRVVRRVAD